MSAGKKVGFGKDGKGKRPQFSDEFYGNFRNRRQTIDDAVSGKPKKSSKK